MPVGRWRGLSCGSQSRQGGGGGWVFEQSQAQMIRAPSRYDQVGRCTQQHVKKAAEPNNALRRYQAIST